MNHIFLKRISEFFFSQMRKDVVQQSKSFFNKKQRYVLTGMMTLIAGMLLYPPYRVEYRGIFTGISGYAWLFNLPGSDGSTPLIAATVDIGLLFAQWVGVLLLGVIGFLLFKEK